ncbi:MAG: gamma-glutamylcyclotransferase [Coleofasciculaceae cyanobacterium]
MNNLKIFVYGTLKPGESNYQRFCVGKVVEEEKAIAYGQLFDLSLGYPGMTIGESLIQGFVLTFADEAILSILDELEDYDPNRLETENEYNRQLIETFDLSGKSLGMVWVYLMSLERVEKLGGVRIDSGCWGV